jgi:hypothetical protein
VASTSEQAVIGLNASARRLGVRERERERELETFIGICTTPLFRFTLTTKQPGLDLKQLVSLCAPRNFFGPLLRSRAPNSRVFPAALLFPPAAASSVPFYSAYSFLTLSR